MELTDRVDRICYVNFLLVKIKIKDISTCSHRVPFGPNAVLEQESAKVRFPAGLLPLFGHVAKYSVSQRPFKRLVQPSGEFAYFTRYGVDISNSDPREKVAVDRPRCGVDDNFELLL